MPVLDLFRESFVGQCIYIASGRRLLQYQEEKPGFVIPDRYLTHSVSVGQLGGALARSTPLAGDGSQQSTLKEDSEDRLAHNVQRHGSDAKPDTGSEKARVAVDEVPVADTSHAQESAVGREYLAHDLEKAESGRSVTPGSQYIVVEWYGDDDPECPLNWSFSKRAFVTAQICLITFSIYIGSSLFAPGVTDLSQKFGVSEVAASVGVTLFVCGYAVGPMVLSPLSEIPQFGRCTIYILTLAIFAAIQVPTALCKNLGALLPLRFLAGFVGSPPLATGGASLADMYAPEHCAIVLGIWSIAAMAGPALGPMVGGFAAQAKGWTWTIWVLLWLCGATLVFLAVTMPETSSQAILCRRAGRLRRLTGNPNLRSQGEIDGDRMTMHEVAMITLVRPFLLGFGEPIVLSWNCFMGLLYGILYCWIESFPVVFVEKHGFDLGQNGLAFLGIVIGPMIAFAFFAPWVVYSLIPKFRNGTFVPEDRMPPGMIAALLLPVSLFWFGWTSGANIHWISPILASCLWAGCGFTIFQAGFNYLVDCYPRYVASALASNDLMRSAMGASFPVFSTAFFHNLKVGPASSVLGGVLVLMMPIPFILHRYGAKIRSLSRYTGML